jgi:CDP-diacylglycerol--glycerol-3-phosphate 3-phosphatidyltransferase
VVSACRPGTAAAAAAVIGVTMVLALRGVRRVPAAPVPAAGAAGGPLIGPRVRSWYRATMAPLERLLVRRRVSADALTGAQVVVSGLAGLAFGTGAMFLAGWLTILAGTLDVLDGGVARAGGAVSPRGALVDSVADRWAEFLTLLGVGVFYRGHWLAMVVVVAGFASLMVSYVRARAEGLGLSLTEGRAQRPERYVVLGFGAWGSGLVAHVACGRGGGSGTHVVLGAAVCVLALLALGTAFQRTRHAVRALALDRGAADPPRRLPPLAEGARARPGAIVRPLAFLVLMLGFGIRLDTDWDALAVLVLGAGAVGAAVGVAGLVRERRARGEDDASSARHRQTGGSDCVPRSA